MTTTTTTVTTFHFTCDLCGRSWKLDGQPDDCHGHLVDVRLLPNLIGGVCIEDPGGFVHEKRLDLCVDCCHDIQSAFSACTTRQANGPYR